MNDLQSLTVNGVALETDPSGALYWRDRRCLVVADLHLEKGSSYAKTGQLLPPYDTAATLKALAKVIQRYDPVQVICLGDSFHDQGAGARLHETDRAALKSLTRGRDWVWIAGNHDPTPPQDLGGRVSDSLSLGALLFRHEAEPGRPVAGEVSGHYHPKATVRLRTGRVTGRCFITDGRRLILPSFGAYTGGLDVKDPALSSLFAKAVWIHLLVKHRVWAFPEAAL